MKFKNIQVGDTVFTERRIRYNWGSYEIFMIPEKVTKVTKTQFTVESGDRYKKEGHKLGDRYYFAYKEGDDRGWHDKKILVCDETKKMNDFILKLELESKFNSIIGNIKINRGSNLEYSEIQDLISKVEEMQSIIKKGNN